MPSVLIAGGTGLVGKALQRVLRVNNFDAMLLSRQPTDKAKSIYHWDPAKGIADKEPFHQADFIVNLAGANIGEKRLTKKRKAEILNSRLDSTRLIGKMLQGNNNVKAIIQASAFGYYGDGKGKVLTEEVPPGNDFLADVCVQWEAAANELRNVVRRVVVFRLAHVLDKEEGLLPKLAQPMRLGVMPVFGSGQQHIPWIHKDDLAAMILYALQNENVDGTYNACSPVYTTLLQLMQTTAGIMKRRPLKIQLPETLIKLGVGELGESFYYDVKLSGEKIGNTGFSFSYTTLQPALSSLVSGVAGGR